MRNKKRVREMAFMTGAPRVDTRKKWRERKLRNTMRDMREWVLELNQQ